jgi:hypothetical protein
MVIILSFNNYHVTFNPPLAPAWGGLAYFTRTISCGLRCRQRRERFQRYAGLPNPKNGPLFTLPEKGSAVTEKGELLHVK